MSNVLDPFKICLKCVKMYIIIGLQTKNFSSMYILHFMKYDLLKQYLLAMSSACLILTIFKQAFLIIKIIKS